MNLDIGTEWTLAGTYAGKPTRIRITRARTCSGRAQIRYTRLNDGTKSHSWIDASLIAAQVVDS